MAESKAGSETVSRIKAMGLCRERHQKAMEALRDVLFGGMMYVTVARPARPKLEYALKELEASVADMPALEDSIDLHKTGMS